MAITPQTPKKKITTSGSAKSPKAKSKPKTYSYIVETFKDYPMNKTVGRDVPLPDSSSLF